MSNITFEEYPFLSFLCTKVIGTEFIYIMSASRSLEREGLYKGLDPEISKKAKLFFSIFSTRFVKSDSKMAHVVELGNHPGTKYLSQAYKSNPVYKDVAANAKKLVECIYQIDYDRNPTGKKFDAENFTKLYYKTIAHINLSDVEKDLLIIEFLGAFKGSAANADNKQRASKFISLMSAVNIKKYPEFFKPSSNILYRGFTRISTRTKSWIRKNLKALVPNTKFYRDMLLFSNPIKYIPERLVQSWTVDRNVAIEFAEDTGAVLITKYDDAFSFNEDFVSAIAPGYENEVEVPHMGKEFRNKVYIAVTSELLGDILPKTTTSGLTKLLGIKKVNKKKQ